MNIESRGGRPIIISLLKEREIAFTEFQVVI